MNNSKILLIIICCIFFSSISVNAQEAAAAPANEKHKKLAAPGETKLPATELKLKKGEDPPAVNAKPIVPGGEFIPLSTADLPLPAGITGYEKNPPQVKLPVQQTLSPTVPVIEINTDASKKIKSATRPIKQR